MTKPDDMLMQRIAQGEPHAVDEALDRYGRLIWSLARRHSPDENEAEDAVQDILLDLWRSAERYDARFGTTVTFVCTIARRRLIDRRRRRDRRLKPDSLELADDRSIDVPDPRSANAEVHADAALALEAMSELSDAEREAILLSTYQGMSHSQIAERTEQPLGTVKTYIRRGLLRVRSKLERPSGTRAPEEARR